MGVSKMLLAAAVATGALALGGCETVERAAVQATTNTYTAVLHGNEIVQGSGDADGYAQAQLSTSDTLDKVCYKIHDIRNLGPITKATISRGRKGAVGPVVVTLKPNAEGNYDNCLERGEYTQDSLKDWAEGFYLTIFTSEYSGGAIRGNFYDSKG